MRGYLFAKAIAVTCVTSLASLTLASSGQGPISQTGAVAPFPHPAGSTAPSRLEEPIVHEGIPGDQIVDGVYVERSVDGHEVLRDASFGTRPLLPVRTRPSAPGYLAGCPCNGGLFENEPDCGFGNGLCDTASDTTNGGCNSTPNVFSPIAVGDTYCGTAYWSGACRDTDWYEFNLASPTRISWRVTAEFDAFLILVGDGVNVCPPVVVTSAFAPACTETTITATLPAGTWAAFIAPDFGGPTFACGAQYSASLIESCQVYLSEATYTAAFPVQTLEDFEDANIAPNTIVVCGTDPATSAGDGGFCFDPGDIVAGLSVGSQNASGFDLAGAGINGYPSNHVGANFQVPTVATFAGGVRQCAMTLVPTPGPTSFTVEVYTPGGALITSQVVAVPSAGAGGGFFGIDCPGELIGRVEVFAASGFQNVDNIRFGSFNEGDCTVYTSAALFDTLYPDLDFEDFEAGNVAPAAVVTCASPLDSAGDGACFLAGDIETGLVITSLEAPEPSGLALIGAGFGANPSKAITSNTFVDETWLEFTVPTRQVGLELLSFTQPSEVIAIRAIGVGGDVIGVFSATQDQNGEFWGIACDRLIARLEFDSPSDDVELVDNVRFGTSKRNLGIRYCSPNNPNSTGNSGVMIVTGSNVDANDDLTLTAMQLPTNSNIGYFLMGTGTNSFIPPGAGSFLCVAPGLKRYLPPVNNTNQFPGGFDRVVGTQGNGHPVSVDITAGSTWNFQAWHRDSNAGTSHFTDAVSVTFQ